MNVNTKEMLSLARKNHFAIPAVNFIDLDSARSLVEMAEQRQLPLILAFAQSHQSILPLEEAALIGNYFAEKATVPVSLHLDHGENSDYIFKAIALGFKSVMIDASRESFAENSQITKQIVEYAHDFDVTVEAELGHVGANDNLESPNKTNSIYTEVKDVLAFINETHVDSLAISIGTAHGLYQGEPKLNFQRLKDIAQVTSIPLVLHGGSSTGDENLKRCAKNGIAKINIYSDLIDGAYKSIVQEEPVNFIELKDIANQAMKKVLNHYYDVFETKPIEM